MKLFKTMLIAVFILALLSASAFAKKDKKKKLPIGAYISQAKIEIVSGDTERLKDAVEYLEDLFHFYGPHSEALFWMGQIEVDYIEKTANPQEKLPHIERFVAYADSLKLCCDKDNKDVKKKYKKNCDEFITKSDSTIVDYWRRFYNDAVNQMNRIKNKQEEISANEADSAFAERLRTEMNAIVDSSAANYNLCLALNNNDMRAYVGLGSLFEKAENYDLAIEWMAKGLEFTEDRDQLLLPIAYNYFKKNDYVGAIPYLKEYVDRHPEDTDNMGYLVICYNNGKFYDTAFTYNQKILEAAPDNVDALNSIGHYFGQLSRNANDTAQVYRDASNDALVAEWNQKRSDYLDSSLVYYERSIAVKSDDKVIHELYATYSYIQLKFDNAISSFVKLTELDPSLYEVWRSLGDCYIQTKDFKSATGAYEKAVELRPEDKVIWEQLVSLYGELKMADKKAAAQKKVNSLK